MKIVDQISTHAAVGNSRISWEDYWMSQAWLTACRSYDPRLRVGCVIVSDDNTRVLAIGYNGNYARGPNEPESLEPGQSGFIHAEVNALIKCEFHSLNKKKMYVTHSPCKMCSKLIVNAGISQVIYGIPYRDQSGIVLMRESGIIVNHWDSSPT